MARAITGVVSGAATPAVPAAWLGAVTIAVPVAAGDAYGLAITGCVPVELGPATTGICEAAAGVVRRVGSDLGSYVLGAAAPAPRAGPPPLVGADPPG